MVKLSSQHATLCTCWFICFEDIHDPVPLFSFLGMQVAICICYDTPPSPKISI